MPDSLPPVAASTDANQRLRAVLLQFRPLAVAVSGGVDSLTLAHIAHTTFGANARCYHARSPAVPPAATERTRAVADQFGWTLDIFDAGEFDDPSYRANPVNRCYFCKANLYAAIARRTDAQIVSGANLDDLGEYRPGLEAARAYNVRHPFIEAGIDKAAIRALAALHGLGEIAALPAAPCLSSRVETGLAINPVQLAMIDAAERHLRATLQPGTVRCRIRAGALVVELDSATLGQLDTITVNAACHAITAIALGHGVALPVSLAPYRNGSAFLRRAS